MDVEVVPAGRWAAAVADRWSARLRKHPALRLCLPTGRTPAPLYAEMAARVGRGAASFRDAEVFLLDEFAVPSGHPARCDAQLRRALLDHIDLPPGRFQRLDPAAPDLGAECDRFARLVAAGGLDLVLLGLGRNGHVGLNEPGSTAASATRQVALHEVTIADAVGDVLGEPPAWGLTLGLREILAAREVWLLVTGAGKQQVLRRVLDEPVGPGLPASYLREHPSARLIADDHAAPG